MEEPEREKEKLVHKIWLPMSMCFEVLLYRYILVFRRKLQ